MEKRIIISLSALLLCFCCFGASQKNFNLSSPDGRISAVVHTGDAITYEVSCEGTTLLAPGEIALNLADGTVYGGAAKLQKAIRTSVSSSFTSSLYKRSEISDEYNELTLVFKEFKLVFRAYDQGVAYRFVTRAKSDFIVRSETAQFNLADAKKAWIPYVKNAGNQFFNSFENIYAVQKLPEWENGRLAFLPILVETENGVKLSITEADLFDYPGMYLSNDDADNVLEASFAPLPATWEQKGHNMLQKIVLTRHDYIAECTPSTVFPWRIVSIAAEDKDLLEDDMVYRIASAPADEDWSWVKPGKVAWDWWNDWNIRGVDFEAGINNDTYKYYIDFASANGIEYVILDEGWAVNKQADLFQVIPEIDLQMLCDYAAGKNVGIILWAGYWAFNRDMEHVCEHYSRMGVKGFKVDFMDSDDQQMVDFHHRAARMGAKYHLMMDFHGSYKPTGLHRTYPNVINFEGVHGLEQCKWIKADVDQVAYDVTVPFIRMLAGPMDYTQGAMHNAIRKNYHPCNTEPMSQGTRCHQLAEYMVFSSPLSMLCDSPSNYMDEPECTEFIAKVPTVWEETVALPSKVGEYVAVARRSGSRWYVGAITDWTARDIDIDLSAICRPGACVTSFADGVNAHRIGTDFRKSSSVLPADCVLHVHMAPGGGYAAVIE